MNNRRSKSPYIRFIHFLWAMCTGRVDMRSFILGCSLLSLLALAHVTLQIYSADLKETISELKNDQFALVERLNHLRSERARLSSRKRVMEYCEKKLGMVRAGGHTIIRVAVQPLGKETLSLAEAEEGASKRGLKVMSGPASTQVTQR